MAEDRGDGVVRVLVSQKDGQTNVYAFTTALPEIPATTRLLPVPAPWHPAGEDWGLAGVKTLSYAPNAGAARVAKDAGFDDALLISRGGIILEAPTAGVLWVKDGTIETAPLDLGILASVTMAHALDYARLIGIEVVEDGFPLERLADSQEVAILATTREIVPVVAVGEWIYEPGPVVARLQAGYRSAVSDLIARVRSSGNS